MIDQWVRMVRISVSSCPGGAGGTGVQNAETVAAVLKMPVSIAIRILDIASAMSKKLLDSE